MKSHTLLVVYFVIYINITSSALVKQYKDYKNYKYYELNGSKNDLAYLRKVLNEDDNSLMYMSVKGKTQVLVPPELQPIFMRIVSEKKLKATLLYGDVSEIIQSEKATNMQRQKKNFSWDAYYDVDDIYNFLAIASKQNPEIAQVIVGGASYEGREIRGLRINTPTIEREDKPVFFIESGIHAREWIAPATTTYFINQLLTSSDPNVTRLRDQFDWRIFPTVNPDGYHYSYTYDRYWRKTVSMSSNGCIGADPNRNWDYNWGKHSSSHKPCDYQLYCGSKPFSEIETRTLSSYISGIDNLLFYVAFHSYASLLLLPFSDSTEHINNYEDLVIIGNRSLEYGSKVNNVTYEGLGTAAEILYKASGGSMDWVRYTIKTPLVYTYELRGQSFHWPASRITEQGREVTQMILGLADGARNLGYY